VAPPSGLAAAAALSSGSAAQAIPLTGTAGQGMPLPGPLGQLGIVTPSLAGAGGPSPRDLARIEQVGKGFEQTFLSTLLKQMRDTLSPDTLFPGDPADVLGGMFDMFLSQHLAQAGSLGIADMVKKQLLQRYESAAVPVGDPHRTGLSGRAVPPTPGA
jgi:hypothetical protein